jgi:DNA-binding NarL/FixJ family response regulator
MLRLVLATEHSLYRAGLRCLLETVDGVKVVAETGSGREVVTLSKSHRPSVVLLEPDLEETSGFDAIGQIHSSSPESRIILLVMQNGDSKLETRAIESGAAGVLSKSSSIRDLERLLRTIREGRTETSDSEGNGERVRRPKAARARGSSPLTPRQLEVLKLLSEGSGVKKIARLLGISAKTVETHRAQVMERLHIYDLVGLVRYALREKITRL